MPRKPPAPVDTRRKLVIGKIWKGEIYKPGEEDILPPDFPMDGPHWDDWEEPERPAFDPTFRNEPTLEDEEQYILDRANEIIAAREAEAAAAERQAEEEYARQNDTTKLPKATKPRTNKGVTIAPEEAPGDPERPEMSHHIGGT